MFEGLAVVLYDTQAVRACLAPVSSSDAGAYDPNRFSQVPLGLHLRGPGAKFVGEPRAWQFVPVRSCPLLPTQSLLLTCQPLVLAWSFVSAGNLES